ncbi:MAG: primosomal protein N' [Candidatus Pacebacteria bacterium]|jgi:primosomal protein N'|nr:primosomal protein N' [Candidatus Paceibacterota bacterium]|tara:strand:+ start:8361 stop:10253 length:1893 start_codon:yes stop_codon:yes gene_type:complete
MQIINVIPIAKGIGKKVLTYYSANPIKEGFVISVPLRKKMVPGIVLSSKNIENEKAKIRSASFALKRIDAKNAQTLFLPEFISAAQTASEYFATTTGAVLAAMTPNAVWDEIGKTKVSKTKKVHQSQLASGKLVLQSEIADRFASYKSLVREEFARQSSVFLLVPTMHDAEKAQEFLKKGIESHTYVLHGTLSKKEQILKWKNVLKAGHPVLIIATGTFLSIPRDDIGTIIVEHENSRVYKQFNRPFIDHRVFAEFLADSRKIQIIFGDLPLKIETMWRYQEGDLDEFSPLKLRTVRSANQRIVDMKNIRYQKAGRFEIIGSELKNLISGAIEKKENVFVFAARRGLSSSTICRDCGAAVFCENCDAPAVLHNTSKGNRFLCHACGASRSANERCKTCASWKLETLGIGIQLVEKKLKEAFPENQIFVIDKDATSTHKQVRAVVEKFYTAEGAVLLGTEMALSYLDRAVTYSAVASIDSLFSLPEWRMPEKILSLLLKVKEITEKEMLIQTRKPNQKVFEYAAKGNLVDFYKDEIKKRKQFGYPPFNTFVKISVVGTQERVLKEMKYAKELLKKYGIQIYPSLVKIAGRKFAMYGLLRIGRGKWPDNEMVEILCSLPPYFFIDVDPESLL